MSASLPHCSFSYYLGYSIGVLYCSVPNQISENVGTRLSRRPQQRLHVVELEAVEDREVADVPVAILFHAKIQLKEGRALAKGAEVTKVTLVKNATISAGGDMTITAGS